MKTILATAYAINPLKGSEDGMGWNFVMQIARFNKVIAITRENNRPHIEKYMRENHSDLYKNISFRYFDLPYWMRFWKKGGRGAMIYYWMWQKGVVKFIKKNRLQFDIAHNLNFHNDWTPSYLWKLGKPFVWGPVGHHPRIPVQYLEIYASKYKWIDRLTWRVKNYFWKMSPALASTIRHAGHIWCMNDGVPHTLKLKGNYSVVPSVATQDFGCEPVPEKDKFTLISAGRFVPLKGFDLTILSFAKFVAELPESQRQKCELLLVGSGPEEALLKNLAKQNGIEKQVKFISWIERTELMKLFKQSSAFIFPSHEGAGMVVPEALSFGLPVICLDNEGPGKFINPDCGFAVPLNTYKETIKGLAESITILYYNKTKKLAMRNAARKRFEELFHWDRRGEHLNLIYGNL